MTDNHNRPAPRFSTLFADPRHFRGDCRLVRTAVRNGWLASASQAERDALVARFERACTERDAAGYASHGQRVRAILAQAWAALEMGRQTQDAELRELRYTWAGQLNQQTGRPRERWHVSDYPHRIDANELRRRVRADGVDLSALRWIDVRQADDPNASGERIALAVVADARYGWRVWLVCPRCARRCGHLYPTPRGIWCRSCAGIAYRTR